VVTLITIAQQVMTVLRTADIEDQWFALVMKAVCGLVMENKGLLSPYTQHTFHPVTTLVSLLREEELNK
jgi:hypothetical protein